MIRVFPRPGCRGVAFETWVLLVQVQLSGSCPGAFRSGRRVEYELVSNSFHETRRLWSETGIALPERERVRLGAWLEERDVQRPLADRVVLAHELVQAAVPEHAVPVLVDVHAV